MFRIVVLFLFVKGSLGIICPVCHNAKDLGHCTFRNCVHPAVCEFKVADSKLNSLCVGPSECNHLPDTCTFHAGLFVEGDKCRECCHDKNCTTYAVDHIIPKLSLSCPDCTDELSAQTCYNNIKPCQGNHNMCILKTDGIHFSSRCDRKENCTEVLPSSSAAGCLTSEGKTRDCISCCTDKECFEKNFHLPFEILSTTHGVITHTSTLPSTATEVCSDDPSFPSCDIHACKSFPDMAITYCRRTCDLCPTTTVSGATVSTTITAGIQTTVDVTAPQPHTAEPCLDSSSFPCSPTVCDNKDLAEGMCPVTCKLCSATNTTLATLTIHPAVQTTTSCVDHDPICCKEEHICQNSLGHFICPNTCPVITDATTPMHTVIQTTASCVDHNHICCEKADICQNVLGQAVCPITCPGTTDAFSTTSHAVHTADTTSTPRESLTTVPATHAAHSTDVTTTQQHTTTTVPATHAAHTADVTTTQQHTADPCLGYPCTVVCYIEELATKCPLTCNRCSTNSTALEPCQDTPGINCKDVCNIEELATKQCPETCYRCSATSTPLAFSTTTHTVHTADITSTPRQSLTTVPVTHAAYSTDVTITQGHTTKPCQDTSGFPCSTVCHVEELATKECPVTCNRCPAISTPFATVPATYAVHTTDVTTTQGHTTNTMTTKATVTTTTKETMCYQCGNFDGDTYCEGIEAIIPPLKPCTGSSTYCMTDVHLSVNGPPKFTRRCANRDQCHKDWWESTSDLSMCVDSDPTVISANAICSYCCTKNECNIGVIPATETLYSD